MRHRMRTHHGGRRNTSALAIVFLLAALLLLILFTLRPAHADETEDPGEHHLPIEMYYNRDFFSEPWRLPDEYRVVVREMGAVIVVNVGLFLILRKWRRSA